MKPRAEMGGEKCILKLMNTVRGESKAQQEEMMQGQKMNHEIL